MPHFICTTCGTRYAETPDPPDVCSVCEDERQYIDIPLPADAVRRVVEDVGPFDYDRVYEFMFDLAIPSEARADVPRSSDRYLRAIGAVEAGGWGS